MRYLKVWPGLLLLGLGLLAHLVTTSPLPQSDYYDDNYAADTKPEAINGGSEPAVDPKTEAEIPTDTETEVKLDEPLGESLPAPAEGEVLVGAAVDSPPAIPDPAEAVPGSAEDSVEDAGRPPAGDTDAMSPSNVDTPAGDEVLVPAEAEVLVEPILAEPALSVDPESPTELEAPVGPSLSVGLETPVESEPSSIPKISPRINLVIEPENSTDVEKSIDLEPGTEPTKRTENNATEGSVASESARTDHPPKENILLNLDESCTHPPDTELCRGHFPKFYFDPASKTCRNFVYGGCRGNKNIYKTAADCYAKCYPAHLTKHSHAVRGSVSEKNYLALKGGTSVSTLTFVGNNAAARVDDQALTQFSINNIYQFEFDFRTDSPHGLIAFLRQVTVPPELQGTRIQLYIYLKRGHLSLTHVFGNNSETFIMNKGGLQEGSWHNALVMVDATRGHLIMEVDASQEDFTINSLVNFPSYTSGNALHGFSSRLWIGGVYKGDLEKEDAVAGFLPYHGCLRDVSVLSGVTSEDMAYVKPLFTSKHFGVREHCGDNCHDRHRNLCSPSSQCVEHFDHSTCKCFNSGQDGRRCSNPDLPVLTLNNDGYVVHRLYEWMDRVHSSNNFISLEFKSRFGDSILFYASAEHPEKQYMGATLTASGRVYVEADFGGGKVGTEIGEGLDSGLWFLLTIIHQHDQLQIYLDGKHEETLTVPGEVHYLHLDPDLYIGNAPGLARKCGLAVDRGHHEGKACHDQLKRYYYDVPSASCLPFNYTGCGGNDNNFSGHCSCMDACYTPGLRSLNTFLGCMRKVFFNDISILNQLREGNKTTRYFGVTQNPPVSSTCNENGMVQVTLSTEKASINLTNPNPTNFRIIVSFRPVRSHGVLASGHVDVLDTKTMWELRHDEHHVFFFVHDNLVHLRPKDKIKIGHWQYVDVRYENNRVTMRVNQDTKSTKPPGPLAFSSRLTIGAPILDAFPGFIGCLRKLEVGGEKVDLRSVVGTTLVDKDVTFDNCQVLGPCERPGSCEHGASCTVVDDDVQCDCSGTGYTGKRCHFSLYKRSCEQYRQIGYTNSGIYKIDVDGNGPLPAAYVKCRFSEFTGETVTIVEHNLPENYEVRRPHVDNVQVQIQYRDFAPNMFKSLISQSNSCTQKVRYDCRRSPLRLYSRTWLSSPSKDFITNFGAKVPGLCRCGEANSCDELDVMCNCDIGDGLPRTDKGTLRDPEHLPITSMVFLQDPREKEDTEGLITLGPLKCIKEASADQTVSFTKPGGYLEVPAWREGSLFLSFKTTTKKAVIAYQPAYHPAHASFKIALTGDKVVELTYTFREETYRHRLSTSRHLNTGSWQQILIDIHDHQLRLAVNSDEEVIDIDQDTRLGVLDGTMYLGAIPPELLTDEDKQEGLEGLVGCIRGLTLNDEVIDLKPFIRVSAHGVTYGCTPSCDPNPCKNGASCIEKWGTYECICKNPLAHSGKNCENNINENAITFITEVSKFKYFVNDTESLGEHNLLNESFLINFRTHINKGLILFAYDYLHNFVQLYLAAENEVVLIFNSGHDVHKLVVTADAGVVFTKGQSVQVSVERSFASTSLRVFTNGVFFNVSLDAGLLLLHEDEYNQFPFGESRPLHEIVYYPHSVTKPKPFFQAYMGSATDKQHDVTSVIPGLVGCIRGLQIGSRPVSLTKLISKSSFPVDDIKVNCSMACDLRPCLNGGFCTEDFQFYNNFHCDCADTSYSGPTCATEIGYTFSGRQWISKDSTTSPIKENFRFELAFSSSKRHSNPQLVALLRSTDVDTAHDYLLVAIERDGSLLVEAQLSDLNQEMVLGAKDISPDHDFSAFDGYRHYVIVEKTDSGMTLKVDRKEHQILPLKNIYVSETGVKTTPTGLYLGGVEAGVDDRLGQYDSFHGCISNVKVLSPDGEAQILKLYKENDMHFKNYGIPGLGSCAGFAGVGAPSIRMTYSNNLNTSAVMGPEWAFRMAQRFTYDVDYVAPSHPERDTRMDDVVPAVSGTIFLLTAILIFVLLLRSHQKRKKTKAHQMDLEEQQPLFNGSRRTKVSTQTEMVSLKAASDGVNQAVKEEPVKDVGIKLEEVPLRETPEEVEQKPEVATKQEPLNGVQGQPTGDTSSESSIDCVIDINDSPTSSPTSPKKSRHPVLEEGSPSSTKVHTGSNSMLFIDEDAPTDEESDGEPMMLSYRLLATGDEAVGKKEVDLQRLETAREDMSEVPPKEEHIPDKRYPQLGDEEVQRIVRDETEEDIEVVDDEVKEKDDGQVTGDGEEETDDQTQVEADSKSGSEDEVVEIEEDVDEALAVQGEFEMKDDPPETVMEAQQDITADDDKYQPEADAGEEDQLEITESQPELQSEESESQTEEKEEDLSEAVREEEPERQVSSDQSEVSNQLEEETSSPSQVNEDQSEIPIDNQLEIGDDQSQNKEDDQLEIREGQSQNKEDGQLEIGEAQSQNKEDVQSQDQEEDQLEIREDQSQDKEDDHLEIGEALSQDKEDDQSQDKEDDQSQDKEEDQLETREDQSQNKEDGQLEIGEAQSQDKEDEQSQDKEEDQLEIREDHLREEAGHITEKDDDADHEQLEDKEESEPEVKGESEPQIDQTPDPTSSSPEEEMKVNAEEKLPEEVTTDAKGDTEVEPENLSGSSESPKSSDQETKIDSELETPEQVTSEPEDDEDEDEFIELRPERDDVHAARRMTSKVTSHQPTFQQFDDHKPAQSDNLSLEEGEVTSAKMEKNKEDKDKEEQIDKENPNDVTENESKTREEVKNTVDGENGREESDFMKQEEENSKKEMYSREKDRERVPAEEEDMSLLPTPIIIISTSEEQREHSDDDDNEEKTSEDISWNDVKTPGNYVEIPEIEDNDINKEKREQYESMEDKRESYMEDITEENEAETKEMESEIEEKTDDREEFVMKETGIGDSEINRSEKEDSERMQCIKDHETGRTNLDEIGKCEHKGNNDETKEDKRETMDERDDIILAGDVEFPTEQRTEPEDILDGDWSLVNQLSLTSGSTSDGETSHRRAGSPVSDGDESGEGGTPTYLNYIQDDDVCLENPVLMSGEDSDIVHSAPTLDTISEQDESEDDDESGTGDKMPSMLNSKFSAGMSHLNTIAEDGTTDDTSQMDTESDCARAGESNFDSREDSELTSKEIRKGEEEKEQEEENEGKEQYEEDDDDDDEEEEEEEGQREEATGKDRKVSRRLKKGHISRGKKLNPVYLSENLRNFNNPISYFGGPDIEYDEDSEGNRSRTESLTSVTSLD
ncbi:uncharacterized protein LOC121853752 isoform X3 [Homarus americanus]|uniref:uncharacterized protein LOC121853752 isoform X3 n=1 Tax=Homarus americanus TaxID=6706 RepID=UPI001C476859|nr:uncharacterized protein LOC121853752 isoform X3 [Homarus americanus]